MYYVYRCRLGYRYDFGACLSILICEYFIMIINIKFDSIEIAFVDEL